MLGVYHKRRLPNYGVFDEERWFAPGTSELELYGWPGVPVGVSVCEDLWFPSGPVAAQAAGGARLIVNVNASPYAIGREADRLAVARQRVAEAGCAIAYVNQVGGQDELVFDGGSFVVDRQRGRGGRRRPSSPRPSSPSTSRCRGPMVAGPVAAMPRRRRAAPATCPSYR